jgi:hypothetical protein
MDEQSRTTASYAESRAHSDGESQTLIVFSSRLLMTMSTEAIALGRIGCSEP